MLIRRLLLMIAPLSILGTPCYADRVYRLIDYPANQNGHFLKGTITTTDDAPSDSLLGVAEILGWQWSLTGANTFAASSTDFSTDASVAIRVRITTEAISLPIANLDAPGPNWLGLYRETPLESGTLSHRLHWSSAYFLDAGVQNIYFASSEQGDAAQTFWSGNATFPSSSGWIVAVAVPEPATALLATTCLLAWFTSRRR